MASWVTTGNIDGFLSQLSKLDIDAFAEDALTEAAPIVEDKLTTNAASHRDTGDMVQSIKKYKPKQNKNGEWSVFVGPSGTGRTGVRNMEKMAYLEYGTKKQDATPVIAPTVAQTEKPVCDSIERSFDKFIREVSE